METATLPNGFQLDLEIVRHIGAAAVIAVTNDPKTINPHVKKSNQVFGKSSYGLIQRSF